MVDKIDPINELNSNNEPVVLKLESDSTAKNSQSKILKLFLIITGLIFVLGLSYYWLVKSDNILQAFIPYDEDKAVLIPDHDQHHTTVHSTDKRLRDLEDKLTKIDDNLRDLSRQSQANISTAYPVESQITDVVARINAVEQRLNQYANYQKKIINLYVTLDQLKEEINQGSAYESTLNKLTDAMRASNDAQNILYSLSEHASVGIANYTQLLDELATIVSQYKSNNTVHHKSNKWWEHIANTVKSIVKVRKIGDNQMIEYKNLYEAHVNIENLLADMSIKPALKIMATFEKDFSPSEHNFYNQMMARMMAEEALLKLDRLMSSPAFIQLLNAPQ